MIFQEKKVFSIQVRKIDLEDDPVSKMRTRKQSLKYIVEIVEKRNKLSQIEADPMLYETEVVVSSTSRMCRKADRSKELAVSTLYFDPGLESSNDALQKKILEDLRELEGGTKENILDSHHHYWMLMASKFLIFLQLRILLFMEKK
ncbi:hypothetical protein KY290_001258 [Solanum tuberosum]|uniref:Uncharacterized protein n=1 Tax=Solanum tuberosum TaxID=4113 RepID=A0ABQ7WLQ8_SOLTU|nr:hypothetical protein KY290_001258 [Solanum tuberosum]